MIRSIRIHRAHISLCGIYKTSKAIYELLRYMIFTLCLINIGDRLAHIGQLKTDVLLSSWHRGTNNSPPFLKWFNVNKVYIK